MRNLKQEEVVLINSDLKPFEQFFKINGLENERYIQKYNRNLCIVAESGDELKGTYAITRKNGEKNTIGIHEGIFVDERKRSSALYHELGHILMGLGYSNQSVQDEVFNSIIQTKAKNPNELKEEDGVYLDGLILLEEYLVEKFSQVVSYRAKGVPVSQRESRKTPPISGEYSYYATFQSNYGIFESLGDGFIVKTYGNITNAIKSGLSEEYFTNLFKTYDNVELMKILGNFGKVKRAIYSYAGQKNFDYEPEEIHETLKDTAVMIEKIRTRVTNNNPSTDDFER